MYLSSESQKWWWENFLSAGGESVTSEICINAYVSPVSLSCTKYFIRPNSVPAWLWNMTAWEIRLLILLYCSEYYTLWFIMTLSNFCKVCCLISSPPVLHNRILTSSWGTKRTGLPTSQHFAASVTFLGLGTPGIKESYFSCIGGSGGNYR